MTYEVSCSLQCLQLQMDMFVDSADFVLALSSECSTGGGVRLPLGLSIKIQCNDFTVSLSSIKFRFICANYTDI